LALKQKVAKNPFLTQRTKLSKKATDEIARQPFGAKSPLMGKDSSSPRLPALKGRIRNKRGEYQSIDFAQQQNQKWLEGSSPDGSPAFTKDI